MQTFSARLDQRLLLQARRLQKLTHVLHQTLPPECIGHFHVARLRQDSLHIITDSPVWTTRLRQLASQIIDTVQQNCSQRILHVQISSRIRYQPVKPPSRPKIKRQLSQKASEQILQSASCIEDDELRHALTRLARRGKA